MYRCVIRTLLLLGILPSCVSQAGVYDPAENSGLIALTPYPFANDVCQVIGENAASAKYVSPSKILIGCPNHERGAIKDRQREGAEIVGQANKWTLLRVDRVQKPTAAKSSTYKGLTIVYSEPQHGTQVEYYANNGTLFLWYPGNSTALPGKWKTNSTNTGQNEVCFQYATNSFNPVTGVRGGKWECQNVRRQQANIKNRFVGDIFKLSSGRIPFVLDKRKIIPANELAKRAGLRSSDMNDSGRPNN